MLDSVPSTVESRKITKALEEQRQHLSQEIHDTICQSLAALKIAAQTGSTQKEIVARIDSLIGESRALLRDIRQETNKSQDLIFQLKKIVVKLNRTYDIKIGFNSKCKSYSIPFMTRLHINRIIQEALINSILHARASKISLTITCDSQQIRFIISDNGKGFLTGKKESTNKQNGYGMQIMQERAKRIQARLIITSVPMVGTQIKLTYQK